MARTERDHRLPADLLTPFLECRTLGHLWDEIPPREPRQGTRAVGHYLFSMRCERCGKERHDAWHRQTGDMVARNYTSAEGYTTIPRDVRSGDLRMELMQRWGEG